MDYKAEYKKLFHFFLIDFNSKEVEERLERIFRYGIDKNNDNEYYLKMVQIKKSYEKRKKV